MKKKVKTLKKWQRGLIYGVTGLTIAIIGLLSYIHLPNLEVDSGLRFRGVIVDKMLSMGSREEFIEMSIASSQVANELQSDDVITTEEHFTTRRDGSEMRVLVFRPTNPEPEATGMLWIHGGGYAVGSPDQEFDTARLFIERTNSVIVSPQYTLSGVAPFPAAFYDAYDTLLWMVENAETLGINPDQIFTGGVSAGGGLAAAVTLYARDSGDVNIAFQMPLYPMINPRMDTPAAIGNNALIWDSARNRIAWELYLGELFGTNRIPTHAAVGLEEDFSDLPPTFTFIGDLDPFYDDIIGWVNSMRLDGVEVEFHRFNGAFHGFEVIAPEAEISQRAIGKMLDAFEYATINFFASQNR